MDEELVSVEALEELARDLAKIGWHKDRFLIQQTAERLAAIGKERDGLAAEVEELKKRGTRAVIAYHVAICSPKGVVPVDDLYDPILASETHKAIAGAALGEGEKGRG